MEQGSEAADRARYVAEFARLAWLGLEQTARDAQGRVVSLTLDRDGAGVAAEAVVAAAGGECRYRMGVWPNPSGHPAGFAANLFATAVEERLCAVGFADPEAQLDFAARRVADRRSRVGDGRADRYLAGALHAYAGLLARYGRPAEALPLVDEAIEHYVRLAEADPERFAASLDQARSLRAACRARGGRSDGAVGEQRPER